MTATPATAVALMRSRFSAFAVGAKDYLLRTWHPSTRPREFDLEDQMEWTRLEIVDCSGGGLFDSAGIVEFRAYYLIAGDDGVVAERSSFSRDDGRWVYVRGELCRRSDSTVA